MAVLSGLEPKNVFYYFEEICKIPHGSGNVDRISDYLVKFAKDRNLFVIQDEIKNVIIIKEATPGYENEPALILQGHMDMVAVKKPGLDMDMKTEGLKVGIDGDFVYAEGTSLGGDDGIAVAYALALLDSDSIKHPKLEVVITVDEEVGMDGARAIDLSCLTGNRMLNLDSEDEGYFLTSCAGGARMRCHYPVKRSDFEGFVFELMLSGLQGGHSGEEINKERGNSNCLMTRVLWKLAQECPFSLCDINGGLADNAISRETKAVIVLPKDCDTDKIEAVLEREAKDLRGEFSTKDPDVSLTWIKGNDGSNEENKEAGIVQAISSEDTRKVLAMLLSLPNGIQSMSKDMPGLVETSLNMGILEFSEDGIYAEYAVRSSVESAKYALLERMKATVELVGGKYSLSGEYPGWKYRKDSPLREKMIKVYQDMYGKSPQVKAIHAGLECGILGSKIVDLDCVAMGPDMKDIHTTEEKLSISSTKRVWEYLVKLLETKG